MAQTHQAASGKEATRIAVCNPMGDLPTLPRLRIQSRETLLMLHPPRGGAREGCPGGKTKAIAKIGWVGWPIPPVRRVKPGNGARQVRDTE